MLSTALDLDHTRSLQLVLWSCSRPFCSRAGQMVLLAGGELCRPLEHTWVRAVPLTSGGAWGFPHTCMYVVITARSHHASAHASAPSPYGRAPRPFCSLRQLV